MTIDKRTRKRLLEYCDQFDVDDCIDPRDLSRPRLAYRKQDRKARQLCRQVAETLDLVLSGDCHDERLQSLYVQSVEPAVDSSRLLVTLCSDLPAEEFDRQTILELLAAQSGRLRCEVARAITRKRAPTLVYHVVGPQEAELT